MVDLSVWKKQADIIGDILGKAPDFDKERRISTEEFLARQKKVIAALEEHGYDCGFVYSDEHYHGDVPYLGGNTNISVEPVAGIIGKKGFFLLAGLEGGYCAEQLAYRSGCKVRKVEMLKLADEDYPVEACSMEGVLEEACGRKPENIAFLSPAEVVPASMYCWFVDYFKDPERVVTDAQELYYKIKYIKSDEEMRMTEQAALICDVMLEGMASVLRPGLYETQVAQWGYAIAMELGAEQLGFDISVASGQNNRTLIGKATNRKIEEGDYVLLGVGPKCDGLTACERASVVCVDHPSKLTESQKYWFSFTEEAFQVGLNAYIDVARNHKPAKLQEQALVDYFTGKSKEVSKFIGKEIDMSVLKPYTGTHNGGYTECQEWLK